MSNTNSMPPSSCISRRILPVLAKLSEISKSLRPPAPTLPWLQLPSASSFTCGATATTIAVAQPPTSRSPPATPPFLPHLPPPTSPRPPPRNPDGWVGARDFRPFRTGQNPNSRLLPLFLHLPVFHPHCPARLRPLFQSTPLSLPGRRSSGMMLSVSPLYMLRRRSCNTVGIPSLPSCGAAATLPPTSSASPIPPHRSINA